MVAVSGELYLSRSAEDILTAAVRDFEPEVDGNFVYSSWLNSYRESAIGGWKSPTGEAMALGVYYKRARSRIDALIKRGAELKVACDPEDTNIILGWMCAEDPVLHYVYVKEAYRRQGIALSLLAACGLSSSRIIPCSHWTPSAEEVAAKRPSLLRRVDLF
jgi:GNAT superfamily N-acetyltransferase